MNEKTFLEQLEEGEGTISDVQTFTRISIDLSKFPFADLKFNNVNFQEIGLDIYGSNNSGCLIQFKNCKGLVLIRTGRPQINEFDFNQLKVRNCSFDKLEIKKCTGLINGVRISDDSKIKELLVSDSDFEKGSIEIHQSEITQHFEIMNVGAIGGMHLSKSNLQCLLKMRMFRGRIDIINSVLRNGGESFSSSGELLIKDSNFDDRFNLHGITTERCYVIGNSFNRGLNISFKKSDEFVIKELIVQNSNSTDALTFIGNRNLIHELNLFATNSLFGTVGFQDFDISECHLSGINNNANIDFFNCHFHSLEFLSLHNKAGLTFSNCSGYNKAELYIENSSLGDTNFMNMDFQSFAIVKVQNSLISNAHFIGGTPITRDQLLVKIDGEQVINERKLEREVFRQLKLSVSRDGDTIAAAEFKAEELHLYRAELKESRGPWYNRFILWLSLSNDMGLNWWKPALWLLGITFLFYFPILICATEELNFYIPSRSEFGNVLKSTLWTYTENFYLYFRLLNPARVLTRLFETPASNWIYVWDFFHRLALAFFTFQIVTAFRKYIK